MRILVIEDNPAEADMVKRILSSGSDIVDIAYNASDGESYIHSINYDLIILDLILPDKDGIELCKSLRRQNNNTRILMLTGRDSVKDRVRGLNSGADDYLGKPFDSQELIARIHALMRREPTCISPVLKYEDISLNTATREVKRGDKIVELTKTEYSILEYFLRNPDIVLTRQMIENHVWNVTFDSTSNMVDVNISDYGANFVKKTERNYSNLFME